MEIFSHFGIDPVKFWMQLTIELVLVVILPLYATILVAKTYRSNGAILLGVALIWFFPIVGPVAAIWAARSNPARK